MAQNTFIRTTFICLVASLVGCTSSGQNFDETKVSSIQKNQTTEAQMVQMFGPPQRRMTDSDGSTQLIWEYNEVSNSATNFIPIYGAINNHTNSSSKTLIATLKGGVVTDYTISTGEYNPQSLR